MSGDGLAIEFQKIQREITIARRSLRYRVIKLARGRMAFDRCPFLTLPSGGFQRLKLFQRLRISRAVMPQLQCSLLFQLALCPP
jgi:hypothetical protein